MFEMKPSDRKPGSPIHRIFRKQEKQFRSPSPNPHSKTRQWVEKIQSTAMPSTSNKISTRCNHTNWTGSSGNGFQGEYINPQLLPTDYYYTLSPLASRRSTTHLQKGEGYAIPGQSTNPNERSPAGNSALMLLATPILLVPEGSMRVSGNLSSSATNIPLHARQADGVWPNLNGPSISHYAQLPWDDRVREDPNLFEHHLPHMDIDAAGRWKSVDTLNNVQNPNVPPCFERYEAVVTPHPDMMCPLSAAEITLLENEYAQIRHELRAIHESQHAEARMFAHDLGFPDEMSSGMLGDLPRLLAQQQLIMDRIEAIEREKGTRKQMDDLGMQQLLLEDREHFEEHGLRAQTLWHSAPGGPARRINSRGPEIAKAQLQRYNRKWADIQSSSTTGGFRSNIPWPTCPSGHANSNSVDSMKWNTHKFFCEVFNLLPISEESLQSSTTHSFISDRGREETLNNLKELRKQLKLEKVRWHEDKLKALFGVSAARSHRAKAVWGAVMDLGVLVEKELESFGP